MSVKGRAGDDGLLEEPGNIPGLEQRRLIVDLTTRASIFYNVGIPISERAARSVSSPGGTRLVYEQSHSSVIPTAVSSSKVTAS